MEESQEPVFSIPRSLKEQYIKHRHSDMEACQTALAEGNFAFLEKVGHQIKGNADLFEFNPLTPIAVDLEVAAQEGNAESAEALLNQLRQRLNHLDQEFSMSKEH